MSHLRQELRAYVATILFGWAQSMHFKATMDMARTIVRLEDEALKADTARRQREYDAARAKLREREAKR